jgi:hypothetical protein
VITELVLHATPASATQIILVRASAAARAADGGEAPELLGSAAVLGLSRRAVSDDGDGDGDGERDAMLRSRVLPRLRLDIRPALREQAHAIVAPLAGTRSSQCYRTAATTAGRQAGSPASSDKMLTRARPRGGCRGRRGRLRAAREVLYLEY